jgi:Transposase DDE domain
MLLDKVFEPFIKETPICVMARGVLQRILDPHHIDQLFTQTAQRQYTNELMFSSLVDLMSRVVLGQEPSVHAAYRKLEDQLPVSDQSVYNKLQHVELPVSAALVRDSALRVAPVIRALRASLPPLLPGYRVKFLDGNHLAATEHRLEELRLTWAAPLPGTVLAVLDQESMTVTDVVLTEDGHAQERSLLDEVYPLVRKGEVWVADRNFCTLGLLGAVMGRGASFVLRQHGNVQGQLLGQRKSKGRCETGWVYEQRLRLRGEEGQVIEVRRITVALDKPTRDGDTEIHILTNLPAKKVSAVKVAEVYRKRWTIEGLFFEAAQALSCEIDTLCYPKAALFAFCLGLLACNAVALLKAALRAEHGEEAVSQQLSAYYLVLEIRQTYAGMMVALAPACWSVFEGFDDAQMARVLREIASHVSLRRYRKTPRGPKKPPPQRRRYKNGEHVATSRLIAERKKQ